jgi:hypothetical protein
MPKQSRPDDQETGSFDAPNDASVKEKAEGSRENVNAGASDDATNTAGANGGGITNRPLDEEEQEQEQLPPRGTAKDGSHA